MTFPEALKTGKPMRRRRAHPTSLAARWSQLVTEDTADGGKKSCWRTSQDGLAWTVCSGFPLTERDTRAKDWEVAS